MHLMNYNYKTYVLYEIDEIFKKSDVRVGFVEICEFESVLNDQSYALV